MILVENGKRYRFEIQKLIGLSPHEFGMGFYIYREYNGGKDNIPNKYTLFASHYIRWLNRKRRDKIKDILD